MKERVQVYYDSEVNAKVHELFQTFEKESGGKRGYTNAKITECLKVYKILGERCGTIEPMDLLLFYIDSIEKQNQAHMAPRDLNRVPMGAEPQAKQEVKDTQKVSEEVDNSVANLLADGGFEFE